MRSVPSKLSHSKPLSDLLARGIKLEGTSRLLQTVRKHLGMDVAFVSHFRETDRVLEYVDANGVSPIHVGLVIPLEEGYCQKVALGELPELIPDTSRVPAAWAIPATHKLPIGSHLSVPIRMHDGAVYGTLCCFSRDPDPSLGERELSMLHAFAEVLAIHVEESSRESGQREAKIAAIRRVINGAPPRIVFQPIYSLITGVLAGLECLSRFDQDDNFASTSHWFTFAEEVGLAKELETASISQALSCLNLFPDYVYLALNCSPQTILSGFVEAALHGSDLRRVVLELTEHVRVSEYAALNDALASLRAGGLRIAIDDAGAGYASMQHIVRLKPDYIKLDISLIRNIDQEPILRALVRALVSFSRDVGSLIIAEGIETQLELEVLRSLGVQTGQGYLLKRPVTLEEAYRADTYKYTLSAAQAELTLTGASLY